MLNITNTNFTLTSNNFTHYLWLPGIHIRFGGAVPDDQPYKYPGTIHSNTGMALVLPGYKIFTTYQGSYDPQ
jgi:hypothetical protein